MFTIISGTNRPEALTKQVAMAVHAKFDELNKKTTLLDLNQLPQALFTPSSYAEKPTEFAPYQKAILETDGIVIVTPEYNGSFPGILKYFIDMLQFPESFKDKPVALIGVAAGHFGAVRSVEQLAAILQYRSAHIFGQRIFLHGAHTLNIQGKSLGNEEFQERFEKLVENFVVFVEALTVKQG